MNITYPNIISGIRVIIAPFFLWFITSGNDYLIVSGCWLFVIGAISDYFDGWLARKYNLESSLGKFLDPLADKFLTSSAFIALIIMGLTPSWMVGIILLRDFGTTLLRIIADNKNSHIATSKLAKIKTFIQMTFIWLILTVIFFKTAGLLPVTNIFYENILKSQIIWITMFIITLLSVWTLIDYLIVNKVFLKSLVRKPMVD